MNGVHSVSIDNGMTLECSVPGKCLGEEYGDPGIPSCLNPTLGIADVIRREAESDTSGIRLAAGFQIECQMALRGLHFLV